MTPYTSSLLRPISSSVSFSLSLSLCVSLLSPVSNVVAPHLFPTRRTRSFLPQTWLLSSSAVGVLNSTQAKACAVSLISTKRFIARDLICGSEGQRLPHPPSLHTPPRELNPGHLRHHPATKHRDS
ncbi:hypothetical protein LY76DRAFT_165158 [Colletotrichum caudatum]|nr:hypothetical protein LY76DRAFT_165158 [Colletotrichum caudatum]